MVGNNTRSQSERWCLLRKMYEVHAMDFEEISLVSRLGVKGIIARASAEAWQEAPKHEQETAASNSAMDLCSANLKTAKQITHFLQHMLEMQTREPVVNMDDADAQAKTRNVLAIAKGVAAIEENIANLENLIDATSQYPQDALEFHRQLEKQIEALANA